MCKLYQAFPLPPSTSKLRKGLASQHEILPATYCTSISFQLFPAPALPPLPQRPKHQKVEGVSPVPLVHRSTHFVAKERWMQRHSQSKVPEPPPMLSLSLFLPAMVSFPDQLSVTNWRRRAGVGSANITCCRNCMSPRATIREHQTSKTETARKRGRHSEEWWMNA